MTEEQLITHYAKQGVFMRKGKLTSHVILDDELVESLLNDNQNPFTVKRVEERIVQLLKQKSFVVRCDLEELFRSPPSKQSFAQALTLVRRILKSENCYLDVKRGTNSGKGYMGSIYRIVEINEHDLKLAA